MNSEASEQRPRSRTGRSRRAQSASARRLGWLTRRPRPRDGARRRRRRRAGSPARRRLGAGGPRSAAWREVEREQRAAERSGLTPAGELDPEAAEQGRVRRPEGDPGGPASRPFGASTARLIAITAAPTETSGRRAASAGRSERRRRARPRSGRAAPDRTRARRRRRRDLRGRGDAATAGRPSADLDAAVVTNWEAPGRRLRRRSRGRRRAGVSDPLGKRNRRGQRDVRIRPAALEQHRRRAPRQRQATTRPARPAAHRAACRRSRGELRSARRAPRLEPPRRRRAASAGRLPGARLPAAIRGLGRGAPAGLRGGFSARAGARAVAASACCSAAADVSRSRRRRSRRPPCLGHPASRSRWPSAPGEPHALLYSASPAASRQMLRRASGESIPWRAARYRRFGLS